MTEAGLRELLVVGHETYGVEVKGSGKRTEKPFLAKVVRDVGDG